MTTITITRRDSGFRNVPPTYLIGAQDALDQNEDEASVGYLYHEPAEYVLPEGYRIVRNVLGEPVVADATDWPCTLVDAGDSESGWLGPSLDGRTILQRA